MKKVLVFGTFDGLHPGHRSFFNQASKKGDYLIVVVARDTTVWKIKNCRPQKNERQRFLEIKKSKLADRVLLGGKGNPYKIIERLAPDVIFLGYDQKVFTEDLSVELRKMNLKTKIYRGKSYYPRKYHSRLVNKIKWKKKIFQSMD
ncbi:MAG: adenylyltransferase/cytidyltransferase family protein [Patescibacteria group bacterium]